MPPALPPSPADRLILGAVRKALDAIEKKLPG
jgi:hypothetical protein